MPTVFLSGGTGYLGLPLIQSLLRDGWDVRALCRPQSLWKLPLGCTPVPGDALNAERFRTQVPDGAVHVHLTGVAHPSPAKAAAFRAVDQLAFRASLSVAKSADARQFVYVSVAHPAPVMKEYVAVRKGCEWELLSSGIDATILRPWYVLGPGHRWPILLVPFYKMAERVSRWREGAQRLGLVTQREMVAALAQAVCSTEPGVRILDVPGIRAVSCGAVSALPPVPSPRHRSPGLWA